MSKTLSALFAAASASALVMLSASASMALAQPIFIGWGPSYPYDLGMNPSVGISETQTGTALVEVHNGQSSAGPLWYRVGQSTASGVNWGPSDQYDIGYNPSIAMAGLTVVEVHNGQGGAGPLWYRVGYVSGTTIIWGSSHPYDTGFNPSMVMSVNVVEIGYRLRWPRIMRLRWKSGWARPSTPVRVRT